MTLDVYFREDDHIHWNPVPIYKHFFYYLVCQYPDIHFNHINSAFAPEKKPGSAPCERFSHWYMEIRNPENKKFLLISYWDKARNIFEKESDYAGFDIENLVELFTSTGIHGKNDEKEVNMCYVRNIHRVLIDIINDSNVKLKINLKLPPSENDFKKSDDQINDEIISQLTEIYIFYLLKLTKLDNEMSEKYRVIKTEEIFENLSELMSVVLNLLVKDKNNNDDDEQKINEKSTEATENPDMEDIESKYNKIYPKFNPDKFKGKHILII
jgi:hypothetical protein